MDLLTGYGSDVSEIEDDHVAIARSAAEIGVGTQVNAVPTARQQQPEDHKRSTAVMDQHEGELKPTNGAGAGLWAQLPRPTSGVPSAPSTSALSSLPAPSGSNARGGGRKVVSMQLPFRKELLAAALDSDDEDEPAAKRVKTTGAKSRLMDFLPPPRYDTAAPRPLGASAREPPKPAATSAAKAPAATAAAPAGGSNGTLPADFFAVEDAGVYNNEAYRVPDDNDKLGPSAYPDRSAGRNGGYYGDTYADPSACYAHDSGPPAGQSLGGSAAGDPAAGRSTAGPAGPAAPEDLIAEALRAEQDRASKRGGGGGSSSIGVKVVEINAKDLTRMDPAAREAANSARDALGPEYALSLRRSAAPFEGSKMARRKHQIGTLLFNARMQELEQLEKRTQGQKSKAETAAKYGW